MLKIFNDCKYNDQEIKKKVSEKIGNLKNNVTNVNKFRRKNIKNVEEKSTFEKQSNSHKHSNWGPQNESGKFSNYQSGHSYGYSYNHNSKGKKNWHENKYSAKNNNYEQSKNVFRNVKNIDDYFEIENDDNSEYFFQAALKSDSKEFKDSKPINESRHRNFQAPEEKKFSLIKDIKNLEIIEENKSEVGGESFSKHSTTESKIAIEECKSLNSDEIKKNRESIEKTNSEGKHYYRNYLFLEKSIDSKNTSQTKEREISTSFSISIVANSEQNEKVKG